MKGNLKKSDNSHNSKQGEVSFILDYLSKVKPLEWWDQVLLQLKNEKMRDMDANGATQKRLDEFCVYYYIRIAIQLMRDASVKESITNKQLQEQITLLNFHYDSYQKLKQDHLRLLDKLYEEGMMPDDYLSKQSLAIRFSNKYRSN